MKSPRSITSRLGQILTASAAAVILAACGGGGAESAADSPKLLAQVATSTAVAQAAGTIRMHFHRAQGDEQDWGVYSWWGPLNPSPGWISGRFMFTGRDAFGGYVDIPVDTGKSSIWFLVTDGYGTKNCGNDQGVDLAADIAAKGQEVWMLEGECTVYAAPPAISYGNLANATAHWLSADTLAWPGAPAGATYKLFYAANGGLGSSSEGVTGADGSVNLTDGGELPTDLKAKNPHLGGVRALKLSAADVAVLAGKLSGQFALAQYSAAGKLVQVTSLQTAGMLDGLFAANAASATLGLRFDRAGVPTFRVWAPTATSVALNVYA
ncbi:MAG TPA: pullulanase-associated domain-containing protein, partial [Telluria sp.]